MFENKISFTYKDDASAQITGTVTTSSEGSLRDDVLVAPVTTNLEVDIDFVAARVKSIFMMSDKDLTLKTNNTTTPGNTINLKAGVPILFATVGFGVNPFTVDVTSIFLTNAAIAGTASANFQIRIGYDPTV